MGYPCNKPTERLGNEHDGSDMTGLRLVQPADIGVLFDAARARHSDEEWQIIARGEVTREAFIDYCRERGFHSLGFTLDGQPIGGIIFDGEAAHIEVLPAYHGRWGFLWKQALAWVFSLKDPIRVAVPASNEKCHRFMARNHWPQVSAGDGFILYEMSSSAPPHYRRGKRGAAVSDGTAAPPVPRR